MNPPARLFFNVLQINSTEKRFRYSSMNRIISDVVGRVPGTRRVSTYFPPRYGPRQDGPHGPSHPGQTVLAYSRFSHLLKRNKTWDTSKQRIENDRILTKLEVSVAHQGEAGADVIYTFPDSGTQMWMDMTTEKAWANHYRKYGSVEGVPESMHKATYQSDG